MVLVIPFPAPRLAADPGDDDDGAAVAQRPMSRSSSVGTQTRGLGPYTLETAIGGRYAEFYGGVCVGTMCKVVVVLMYVFIGCFQSVSNSIDRPCSRRALPAVVRARRRRAACTCDPARIAVQTIDRHLPGSA